MGTKGFGVGALSDKLDEKKSVEVVQSPSVKSKTISSPINSPGMTKNQNRIQRLYIDLPVSKNKTECEFIEILPDQCEVSKLNKRVQSLLSPDDPAIIKLKKSILEDSQRDPVLIRPSGGSDETKEYELIYGSRRRYVIGLLIKEGVDIKLKAWVASNISDADAKKLADSENEDRQAISAWEIAKYYQSLQSSNKTFTAEVIASSEDTTASSVRRYLQLANLPEEVVKKMESPSEISLRSGLDILKIINQQQPDRRSEILKSINKMNSFSSSNDFLKTLKQLAAPKVSKVKKTKAIEIIDANGNQRATIGTHRSQKGKYKIDLYDVQDAEITEVIKALEAVFK